MSRDRARWLALPIGFAVTAAFVWLLARDLDPRALGRAFAALSMSTLLLALAFLACGYAVRIVRWWWMLHALEPGLPLRACVRPFLASIAVNNLLPLRAGDVLRAVGFRRQLRSPVLRVLGTVVIERILDLLVLLGIFFLGLLGLPDPPAGRSGAILSPAIVSTATWLAGLGVATLAGLVLLSPWLAGIRSSRFLAERRWAGAVSEQIAHLAEAFGVVRSAPRLLALLGLSAIVWICEGAVFVCVAAAFAAGGMAGPWFSMAIGSLSTLLPSMPGHVGTFDYFTAQGLAVHGASPEVATAFALAVHVVLWLPLTVAGLLCLQLSLGGIRDLRRYRLFDERT